MAGEAADRVAISSMQARMRQTMRSMDVLIVKAQHELMQMRRVREQLRLDIAQPFRAGFMARTDGSD